MGKKKEKIRNTFIKSKVILSLKKERYTSIIIDNLKEKNEMKEILYNISIKIPTTSSSTTGAKRNNSVCHKMSFTKIANWSNCHFPNLIFQ